MHYWQPGIQEALQSTPKVAPSRFATNWMSNQRAKFYVIILNSCFKKISKILYGAIFSRVRYIIPSSEENVSWTLTANWTSDLRVCCHLQHATYGNSNRTSLVHSSVNMRRSHVRINLVFSLQWRSVPTGPAMQSPRSPRTKTRCLKYFFPAR